MALEVLEAVKQQIAELTLAEKQQLAEFLSEQTSPAPSPVAEDTAEKERKRRERAEWLEVNREAYAGQYVALDGDKLVGHGRTIREAHEQAKQQGVPPPFLVRLPAKNEILWGGW